MRSFVACSGGDTAPDRCTRIARWPDERMSFKINIAGVDVSDQVRSVTLTQDDPPPLGFKTGGSIRPQRLKPADCPHSVTSTEGREWIRANCMRPDDNDVARADKRISDLGMGRPRWGILTSAPDPDPADPAYLDRIAPERLQKHGGEYLKDSYDILPGTTYTQAIDDLLAAHPGTAAAAMRSLTANFQVSINSVSQTFQSALDALDLLNININDEPEVHTIRGMPAGRVRQCHHGNVLGSCRPCSQKR